MSLPPEPPIVKPADLHWIYGIIEYQPIGYYPGQNSLVVVGIQLLGEQDLAEFMNEYQTSPGEVVTYVIRQMGGNPVVNLNKIPDKASTIAFQYTMAMAYPTLLTFYCISQQPSGDDLFLKLILFLTRLRPLLNQAQAEAAGLAQSWPSPMPPVPLLVLVQRSTCVVSALSSPWRKNWLLA